MDIQNKNSLPHITFNNYGIKGEGVIMLLKEMISVNSSKSDISKIENLYIEINKAFLFAKGKEFSNARKAFVTLETTLNDLFEKNSFEFYCSQLLYLPRKSYFEYKINEKDCAIATVTKSIKYALLIQDYPSSHNIPFYISQMLDNLAEVYMTKNEINEWRNIVLQNIHFLSNVKIPEYCKSLKTSKQFNNTPLRYLSIINVLSASLISVVKYKLTNGYELINSIVLENTSEPIMAQIDAWIKLNIDLDQKNGSTESFAKAYNKFLNYNNSEYDLKIIKLFLKNRVKKEKLQLYNYKSIKGNNTKTFSSAF